MKTSATTMTAAERALYDQTNLLPRPKLLVVFGTLSVVMLIFCADQNGIGTILPTVAGDLNAANTISWAGTSSLIANTTFQMLYGRLSDIFGRKTVFLSAIALLTVADLLCGLSTNPTMFYVFRGIAGIGGGGIGNLTMIIVSDIVTLHQRGKYQGILGAMAGIGNAGGPFIAAALAENASWNSFFYMLAPLGATAGLISWYILPGKPPKETFTEGARKIDYAGLLLMSTGVICLLIPISGGGAYFEWDSALVITLLIIGSISLIAFVIVEWKLARLPMMPVTIFQSKAVTTLLIQSFIFGSVMQSLIYYVPLYLQNARQFSVVTSATIFITIALCHALSSVITGQYMSRTGRYGEVIWFGLFCLTLGCGLTLALTRHSSPGMIVGTLIVVGLGIGSSLQPILVALQAHSLKSRRAVIISSRNFFRCAGGAVGLAISAAVLQASLRAHLPEGYKYLANSTYAIPRSIRYVDEYPEILDAYMAASHSVFLLQVPCAAVCLLGCLLVRDRGLGSIDDGQTEKEMTNQAITDPSDFPATGGILQQPSRSRENPNSEPL